MDNQFIDRLPRRAVGKDFRVIADEGGYGEAMAAVFERISRLNREGHPSPHGELSINAQRDSRRLFLKVTVTRDSIAFDGVAVRFDGAIGELLTLDGMPTGRRFYVNLSIDPSTTQAGQTVGVLRLQYISHLPEAM